MDDMLIAYGSEIKAVGNGRVEGYLVRFSTPKEPDLEGDFFSKETDFGIHERLPLYYHHGFDSRIKGRRIGAGNCSKDDIGIWFEAQMDMRDEYEKMIYSMVEAGKLGYSSGAIGHLVDREPMGKAYHIKCWPLGEASLTPTPAEPRNMVMPVKSLQELLGAAKVSDTITADISAITSVRAFEEFLREAGFPNAAAVTIASKGFNALCQRDSEEDEQEATKAQLLRDYALLDLSELSIGV